MSIEIKKDNRGRPPKPLSKEMCLRAIENTKSNKAAARYLGVSYIHFKKWAKLYIDEATGKNLFELHKNQAGKGINKFWSKGSKKGDPDLLDIMEGRVDPANFNPQKLKYRLINDGYLKEQCNLCNMQERRVVDYKMPLLLHFKDNNKKNWRHENLELLCYNCFFLTIGDVFTNKQIQGLEEHLSTSAHEVEVDWQLDDYQKEMLKKLGFGDPEPENSGSLISYI